MKEKLAQEKVQMPNNDFFNSDETEIVKNNNNLPFIIAVLLILSLILLVGAFKLKKSFSAPTKIKTAQISMANNFTNTLKDKKVGESVDIKISEGQINDFITGKDLFLKQPQAKITTEALIISGKTSNGLFGLKVNIFLNPEINAGKLSFRIAKIESGGVIAPKSLIESITPLVAKEFANITSLVPNNFSISSARLLPGEIIIEGQVI